MRRQEMLDELVNERRNQEDYMQYQKMLVEREIQKKLTLKERLIKQKQERLNEDLRARDQERVYGPTSLVYNEQARRKPNNVGVFNKTGGSLLGTVEAFHKNKNQEINEIKKASLAAKTLGPHVSDKCQETFKLLRSGVTEQIQVDNK